MGCFRTTIPYMAIFLTLFTLSEGKEILVGGKENSWAISSSSLNTLNERAAKTRFRVGHVLIWKYNPESESVLEVTKENYESCITSKPIKIHKDGNTKIELDRSGLFYFISGSKKHCDKGLKLAVVVMSEHHDSRLTALVPATAPAPGTNGARRLGVSGFAMGVGSLVVIYDDDMRERETESFVD